MLNYRFKLLSSLIACLFLVVGCSSKPTLNLQPEKPMPNWYLNPASNTSEVLTGVGAGETLELATQSALNDLIARLGVSIESKFESVTESTRYTYSKRSKEEIKSEVAKIRISNYELVTSEQVRYNQYVALVQSKREQFVKDLTQQINDRLAAEQHAINLAKTDNALKRYYVAEQAYQSVRELESNIIVLSSMDSKFNNEHYQNQILKFRQQSEDARRHINFVIKADQRSTKTANPIKNALSQQGFAVGNSNLRDGVLVVNVVSSVNHSESHGFQIADIVLQIRVTDHQNRQIGANTVSLRGAATRGAALAEEEAIREFSDEIKAHGIANILGIAN